MLWRATQEASDVISWFQHSVWADLKEFFVAMPFTGRPSSLRLPFGVKHALHLFPIAEIAYNRSACRLVGPISSRRFMTWEMATLRPESNWKSDGGLISISNNG